MSNVLTMTGRELRSYFVSPMAYVVMAALLVAIGFFGAPTILFSQDSSLRYLFSDMGVVLLLVSPLLTMRLMSEEQKSGTVELLLTSPVRDSEVVVGKFLASLLFLGATLVMTIFYPILVWQFGKPDWGPILSGYLGVVLLGGAYLSIGLLTSSLTQNQIVAAVLSFAILMALWLVSWVVNFIPAQYRDVAAYLGIMDHFDDFTKGVIGLKDAVFYLSIIVLSLVATVRVFESRRWK